MAKIGPIRQIKTLPHSKMSWPEFWEILANLPRDRFKKIGRITQISATV